MPAHLTTNPSTDTYSWPSPGKIVCSVFSQLLYRRCQDVCSGAAGGALACSVLALLKQPVAAFLDLQPDVQHHANPYWWIRVALAPLVLLNMTISGILQVCLVCSKILTVTQVCCYHMLQTSHHAHPMTIRTSPYSSLAPFCASLCPLPASSPTPLLPYQLQKGSSVLWGADNLELQTSPSGWQAIAGYSVQGYNEVTTASILISLQALLEIGGSILVFSPGLGSRATYLQSVGFCTIISAAASATAGMPLLRSMAPATCCGVVI